MRHLKRNGGFTLVELVVGIACASMVMAAAAALLLMGARIQRVTLDEAREQQTVRIVLTMLEDMVSEGQIKSVETSTDSWKLMDGAGTTLLTFENGQLLSVGDSVLLDGLTDAKANLHGNLLNFTFTTNYGTYETSTYCRTVVIKDIQTEQKAKETVKKDDTFVIAPEGEAELSTTQKNARYNFLKTLVAEYGSTGEIKATGQSYCYYSEWYIGGYADHPGWNSSTPWCACFLSWAAAQHTGNITGDPPKFANVGDGWDMMSHTDTPIPGDYIFFDWEGNNSSDPDHGDLDHVGAVLYVSGGLVYTIEGNSGGRVAIHSYALGDPRIYGYGVLDWT